MLLLVNLMMKRQSAQITDGHAQPLPTRITGGGLATRAFDWQGVGERLFEYQVLRPNRASIARPYPDALQPFA